VSYPLRTELNDDRDHEIERHPTLCQACAATKVWVRAKRLMTRGEVNQYLALSSEQVQWLINTGQI
jgi:hypothetical protein